MGPLLLRLVAESVVDDTFVLDGIVQRHAGELGEPVTIVLARPETAWFDGAVEQLLEGWARRSEAVSLQVSVGRRGSVAELECRTGSSTTVRLDLLDVG